MSAGSPDYLTPEQVAERFQLRVPTILRALREGRMPGVKILGRWRIDPADLDEWIASKRPMPSRKHKPATTGILAEIRGK